MNKPMKRYLCYSILSDLLGKPLSDVRRIEYFINVINSISNKKETNEFVNSIIYRGDKKWDKLKEMINALNDTELNLLYLFSKEVILIN